MFNLKSGIMKKVLFAFCFMLGTAALVNAQDTTSTTPTQPQPQYHNQDQDKDQDKDKQAISPGDLPAAVTQQLQTQEYNGWTLSNAFKKEKDGETIYIVEVKNGAEVKKIKFDAQGNKLKEKEKKDN
jgi:uncharacterized membrane protein YkoI